MKRIFLMLGLAVLAFNSIAQEVYSSSGRPVDEKKKYDDEEVKGFDPSKLIFGGGFVFGVGGGVTNLGVMPVVGYRFTDRFAAGIGLGYQYYKVKDAFAEVDNQGQVLRTIDYKTSIYRGSLWARYVLFGNIFVHIEPELNSLDKPPYQDQTTGQIRMNDRVMVPCLLAGGGIRQPLSDRVSFVAMILYDVLQEPYSPYMKTVDFRIGVNVGF
jgi:hypothetical protein